MFDDETYEDKDELFNKHKDDMRKTLFNSKLSDFEKDEELKSELREDEGYLAAEDFIRKQVLLMNTTSDWDSEDSEST